MNFGLPSRVCVTRIVLKLLLSILLTPLSEIRLFIQINGTPKVVWNPKVLLRKQVLPNGMSGTTYPFITCILHPNY